MPELLLALKSDSPAWTIPDADVATLRSDFPSVRVVDARDDDAVRAAIPSAEIVFSWALGDAVFANARALRWLHSPAAGVGAYLTPSILDRGDQAPLITNSRGVHAIPIAEHILGFLIALTRRFSAAAREQDSGAMQRERWWDEEPGELFGKTLGLYGYGAIARETARRAIAFGMRVVALRRDPGSAPWEPGLLRAIGLPLDEPPLDALFGPNEFERFLEESDAVVITAALTPETEGRFDARAFARMRPGSVLVNVARGKIVREGDLVEALRRGGGRPAAAALDVFEREPLPRESPLYTLDNVILTPHVSGLSTGYWPRSMSLFRANLTRYLEGAPLWNRVDPRRGY
jgi:phosphoglycerate dehydrogenase-like enzyme